jgi:hypothetical protein
MKPLARSGRVDRLLTNISLAYVNRNYIADLILPTVPNLKNDSGKIGSYSNDHLRVYSAKRSLYDTAQRRIEWTYSQDDNYNIEYFDLDGYVPDRLAEQTEAPFDAERDATLITQQSLMLEREVALASIMTDTSVLTQNVTLSGTSQFSDYLNSTPEIVIRDAKTAVFNATGMEANRIAMSREVLVTLQLHPFFLDLNKGRNVRAASEQDVIDILKTFFGFTSVYIGNARYISTKQGQAETLSPVWNKDMVIFYTPESPSLMTNSFGYSFQLAGRNYAVSKRREPNSDKGVLINVEHARDDKILIPTAGYLVKNAVA